MRVAAILVIMLIFSNTAIVYAQEESRKIETLEIPASAFNAPRDAPEVFPLQYKHAANFITNVKNELIYNSEYEEAKAVIRFGDNELDKFFELVMYDKANRLSVSLFVKSLGYTKYYEDDNSWFDDKDMVFSFAQNDRLSLYNGQRNIMDRFRIGMFTLDTIEVYGKDSLSDPDNVVGGKLVVEVLSGNPLDNPISYMPVVAVGVVGAILLILLKTKKR